MIKKFFPQYAQCKIAAISPCYSKRREFESTGFGDYNVTFKSIQDYLDSTDDKIRNYKEVQYDGPFAERAVLFSSPGGLMRTVKRYDKDVDAYTRKIEGAPEIYHYLSFLGDVIKNHTMIYSLIDCLSCKMGCNAGPGTLNKHKHLEELDRRVELRGQAAREFYGNSMKKHFKKSKRKLERLINDYWIDGLYTRTYCDRSSIFKQDFKLPSEQEIKAVYLKMHKHNPRDFLNCAACGYTTCEQMAIAILNNLNHPENCKRFNQVQKSIMVEQHKAELARVIDRVHAHTHKEINKSIEDIGTLYTHINDATSVIVRSSATIGEILKNIGSVHKTLEHNAQTVMKLNSSSIEGKKRILKIGELITSVSTQSSALIDISKLISNIADETSILGMNAAIEAAHAGEGVGKGFAVVAGQIRHLANNSGNKASEIENRLKGIKTLIDASYETSSNAQTQFDVIVSLINEVKSEEANIYNAVDVQNKIGHKVIDELNEVNTLIFKIKDEASSLLASGKVVLNNIDSLKDIQLEKQ